MLTPEEFLMVATEVRGVPAFQLVQNAVEYEWKFAMNHIPRQTATDEEPPVRINDKIDGIEIDGSLGLYDPSKQLITIFKKGISRAAQVLDIREPALDYVVCLHEWAHALVHVGLPEKAHIEVTCDESSWPRYLKELTLSFEGIDREIHEALAQLIASYVIQDRKRNASHPKSQEALERIGQAFQKLMRRAPRIYDITDYTDVPKEKILKSIQFLKHRSLIGFETWETVVRW